MNKNLKTSSIVVGAFLVVVLLWIGMYPDKDDPKNIHYLLWKWHLAPIDLDRAVVVMHHDTWSEGMILGKSEEDLTKRFGYLMTPEETSPCNVTESKGLVPVGDKALYLRKSNYLIVFHNGIAVDFVLLNEAEPC